MKRWLSKASFLSHFSRPRTIPTKRRHRSLFLERLEDRVVPTLFISLQEAGVNGGAPTIVATGADFTAAEFTGTYGDFSVDVFGGASHNGANQSFLVSSTTSVENIGASTATLNLAVFQDNYTLPAGSPLAVESGLGGSVNAGTLSLSNIFQASASSANSKIFDFTNGPQTATMTGSTFDTGSVTGVFNPIAGNPYALSSNVAINLTAGGQINYSDHVIVTAPFATPTINTTQQPASATVGSSIADQATVSGGNNPTGTVTFNLYNNPNGTGPALFTETETLSGGVATSKGYTATATGTDYWVATYNGDSNNNAVSSGAALEPVVISPSSPAINTSQQPATATVGSSIADMATVSGGNNPTGTVTFNLYSNPNGTGTPLFTDTETLSGGIATSKGYTATATGTDYWVATYNGDSNNGPVTSGTALEPVIITPPGTPCIKTCPGGTVVVGSSAVLKDTATLSGGNNPTGTITFTLYAPNGTTIVDTETVTVTGDGTYRTPKGFIPTAIGTYQWVASYNGDSANRPVAGRLGSEPECVIAATPALCTTPGCSVVVGSGAKMTDSATLSGGANPTGTLTFTLYAPNGTTIVDTEKVTVKGAGTYTTPTGFVPTAAGTYQWVVSYSGDSRNNAVADKLGNEPERATFQCVSICGHAFYDNGDKGQNNNCRVIAGCTVILDDRNAKDRQTTHTYGNGNFCFNSVGPGNCKISFACDSSSAWVQTHGMTVDAGNKRGRYYWDGNCLSGIAQIMAT